MSIPLETIDVIVNGLLIPVLLVLARILVQIERRLTRLEVKMELQGLREQ